MGKLYKDPIGTAQKAAKAIATTNLYDFFKIPPKD